MDRKIMLGVLVGLILGIIAGVELVELSGERVCPQRICLDSETEVIPVSNKGYFPVVHEILVNADSTIHLSLFELKYYEKFPNSSVNILVEDLIDAHNRGVEVLVLLDQFSTENNAIDVLRENGIEVRMDPEDVTTHTKLVIVDGKVVVLGSTNLSFYGLEKNNEIDVVLKGEHATEYYEHYFWTLWNG